MEPIKEFNKQNLKEIRSELEKALAVIGEKYQLNLEVGNIRFSNEKFSTKLVVTTKYKKEITITVHNNDGSTSLETLRMGIPGYQLVGKVFIHEHKKYTVIRYVSTNKKYPIILERSDGKFFKIPTDVAEKWIAKGEVK